MKACKNNTKLSFVGEIYSTSQHEIQMDWNIHPPTHTNRSSDRSGEEKDLQQGHHLQG